MPDDPVLLDLSELPEELDDFSDGTDFSAGLSDFSEDFSDDLSDLSDDDVEPDSPLEPFVLVGESRLSLR